MTHLHNKTNEEVESSHGDEQHFEIQISEVVQLKLFANERPRIHHLPSHYGKKDKQQAEENHWKDEKKEEK